LTALQGRQRGQRLVEERLRHAGRAQLLARGLAEPAAGSREQDDAAEGSTLRQQNGDQTALAVTRDDARAEVGALIQPGEPGRRVIDEISDCEIVLAEFR